MIVIREEMMGRNVKKGMTRTRPFCMLERHPRTARKMMLGKEKKPENNPVPRQLLLEQALDQLMSSTYIDN